jgi:hypothetical protein
MDILRRIRRRPSSAKENQPNSPASRPVVDGDVEHQNNGDVNEIHDEPLSTSTPTKSSANGGQQHQSLRQKMKVSRKSIDKLMRKMKLKKDCGSSSEKVKDDGHVFDDEDHDDDDDVVEPKDLVNDVLDSQRTDDGGSSDEGIVRDDDVEPDSPRNEVKIVLNKVEPIDYGCENGRFSVSAN